MREMVNAMARMDEKGAGTGLLIVPTCVLVARPRSTRQLSLCLLLSYPDAIVACRNASPSFLVLVDRLEATKHLAGSLLDSWSPRLSSPRTPSPASNSIH